MINDSLIASWFAELRAVLTEAVVKHHSGLTVEAVYAALG